MESADLRVNRSLSIPADEIRETASRSGGPGGQHVNKVATRVTLRWNPATSRALGEGQRARLLVGLAGRLTRSGDLVIHAGRRRSRDRNREQARQRLAELVREALAVRPRRLATRPTRAAGQRRIAEKRRRGVLKRGRQPSRDEDG